MTIQKTHSLETMGGVSLAAGGAAADGADMRRTQEPVGGLSLGLLDALRIQRPLQALHLDNVRRPDPRKDQAEIDFKHATLAFWSVSGFVRQGSINYLFWVDFLIDRVGPENVIRYIGIGYATL